MNKIKDAFSQIQAEDELKQKTLQAITAKSHVKKPRSLTRVLAYAASAACAVVVFVVGGVLYTTPTAAVSIDVNPSIELSLNRFDRVLEAVPKNEDGKRVLAQTDVANMKYADALGQIVNTEETLGYLGSESNMVFAVQSDDTAQRDVLLLESESYASRVVSIQNTTCYAASGHEWAAAHQYGISAGKYKAIQELQQYDPAVTIEEYSHHSMHDIRQEIHGHQYGSGNDETPSGETGNHGNGSSYGNGSGQGHGATGGNGQGGSSHGNGHHGGN